jgi:hypothetical protein
LWAPDGTELYYQSPDAIMAVSVETDPALDFTGKGLRPIEIRYFMSAELVLAKAWIGIASDQVLK